MRMQCCSVAVKQVLLVVLWCCWCRPFGPEGLGLLKTAGGLHSGTASSSLGRPSQCCPSPRAQDVHPSSTFFACRTAVIGLPHTTFSAWWSRCNLGSCCWVPCAWKKVLTRHCYHGVLRGGPLLRVEMTSGRSDERCPAAGGACTGSQRGLLWGYQAAGSYALLW